MKKLKLFYLLLGLPLLGNTQNLASGVVEYFPAPGQHINIENMGTPQAALQMPVEEDKLVSLGGFGGYIVLKFDKACVNDPANPYGVDFTVFGNAFTGSSEAGVVWVMKDENNNGQPDDTWYEIAGSHYFFPKTIHNYQLTYFKTDTRDVNWKDNRGASGTIKANSYNLQEYYPTATYFPGYPADSVTLGGTLLPAALYDSNPMEIKLKVLDFGYADNHPKVKGVALTVPDNPYTEEAEGAGGDPIDISWAVDAAGNYVNLDSIHFVKIVTGYFASLGRLGEASTDVSFVVDIEPNEAITGKENLLVVYQHPEKLLVGDSLQLEARYFTNGRPVNIDINYSTTDVQNGEVTPDGKVKALQTGSVAIQVSSADETKSTVIQMVEPDSIQFLSDFSSVYPGDTVFVAATVFDNWGDSLATDISFTNLSPESGRLIQQNNQWYFVAENPGPVTINCAVPGFILEKSISFQVFAENDKMHIYFTLKTENEKLLPFQWIEVGKADLNAYVENRTGDYSTADRLILSHALLAGLQKAGVNFSFQDDESSGGKLYLYSVEKDGFYTYGWGGRTDSQAFAKAWIARLNHQQFLNDFNSFDIANGDTVSLYHVSDITNPWTFMQLSANKDSVTSNEQVEVSYRQTECQFQNGVISEADFTPIANREIIAGQSYFTGEDGKVTFTVENAPMVISSGNDAVLLEKKVTTGNHIYSDIDLQIYPNPVTDRCIISGKNLKGAVVSLFTENGQNVFRQVAENNRFELNVQKYTQGIYFLRVVDKESVITRKIVKE